MQAVILAAGMGNRLGDLTDDMPKATVKACGKELIRYAIDFASFDSRIDDIIVVTGFKSEILQPVLDSINQKLRIVHNPRFEEGNILSVATAMDLVDDAFIMMNVDHIYPNRLIGDIISRMDKISGICDNDRTLGADDMKVKVASSGAIEKISKNLNEFDYGYIGMTTCEKSSLKKYKNALSEVISNKGTKSCAEDVLGHLAAEGERVNICNVSGISWLEIDTKDELIRAEDTLCRNRNFLNA